MTPNLGVVPATEECTDGCSCCGAAAGRGDHRQLRAWAWWLTATTIGWNSIEALVAIGSGVLASSIVLVGFGLDSVVEVASALIIAWRLTRHHGDERAERRAVRLIALTFFGIAAYITVDAVLSLAGVQAEPHRTPVGLTLTALSVVVMPLLAWAKRRVAGRLGSVALKADAAETQLCTYLAAVVFVGLAANALVHWWWADPLAGLVVAVLAFKEGREAWANGDLCCP